MLQARDHFERQQPGEKRIIEYIISISDPSERRAALDKAVTPGPTRFTDTHDYLWATPQVGSACVCVRVGGCVVRVQGVVDLGRGCALRLCWLRDQQQHWGCKKWNLASACATS